MKTSFFLEKGFILGSIIVLLCTFTMPALGQNPATIFPLDREHPFREPLSHDNITVPDCVQIGDIVLIDFWVDQSNLWKRPGLYNEHSGIYIGNNTLIEANGAVRYRNYSLFHEYAKNLAFLRVKTASESQRIAVVEWAKSKIGLPYQGFFDYPWFGLKIANTDRRFPTANEMYCMELLWAAYYVQGIDIDRNGWKFPCWVDGNDIIYDDDIEIIYREVADSTEIIKPYKGVYLANRKIAYNPYFTMVLGDIDIEVNTSNENVTHVDFYIDKVYKGTDVTPPFSWRWDEKGSGKISIRAVACDDFDNEYSARLVVLKVF